MCKLERNHRANSTLFHINFLPLNVGIKPAQYEIPGKPNQSFNKSDQLPHRPFVLCTAKEFNTDHFTLNSSCGVDKLSSTDIMKTINTAKVCHSCAYGHAVAFHCTSKICTKGCTHDGFPLHGAACKHSDEAPSFTVSKLGSNKSIPLVESIDTGSSTIGIQYDLGSQLSLISKSAL